MKSNIQLKITLLALCAIFATAMQGFSQGAYVTEVTDAITTVGTDFGTIIAAVMIVVAGVLALRLGWRLARSFLGRA